MSYPHSTSFLEHISQGHCVPTPGDASHMKYNVALRGVTWAALATVPRIPDRNLDCPCVWSSVGPIAAHEPVTVSGE